MDGLGQADTAPSRILGGQGLALFGPEALPRISFAGAVGCAEAATGWEPVFLTLSGVQGGSHCITLGASIPGFLAS